MGTHVNTVLCMQDLRTLIRYYFDIKIYIWEHFELELKSKLKLSNMCMHTLYHTPSSLRGLYLDWKIEDSDGS